jgi:hypothetical protein
LQGENEALDRMDSMRNSIIVIHGRLIVIHEMNQLGAADDHHIIIHGLINESFG